MEKGERTKKLGITGRGGAIGMPKFDKITSDVKKGVGGGDVQKNLKPDSKKIAKSNPPTKGGGK